MAARHLPGDCSACTVHVLPFTYSAYPVGGWHLRHGGGRRRWPTADGPVPAATTTAALISGSKAREHLVGIVLMVLASSRPAGGSLAPARTLPPSSSRARPTTRRGAGGGAGPALGLLVVAVKAEASKGRGKGMRQLQAGLRSSHTAHAVPPGDTKWTDPQIMEDHVRSRQLTSEELVPCQGQSPTTVVLLIAPCIATCGLKCIISARLILSTLDPITNGGEWRMERVNT